MPAVRDPLTRAVLRLMRGLSALGMFLMMAITFLDVVGRYFMRPIFGAPEMIQFLLAFTIFAAMGLASASRDHITVDMFAGWLSRSFGRAYDLFLQVVSLLGFCMIAWQLGRLAVEAQVRNSVTIVLEWPLLWVLGPVAVLATLAVWIELAGLASRNRDADRGHAP